MSTAAEHSLVEAAAESLAVDSPAEAVREAVDTLDYNTAVGAAQAVADILDYTAAGAAWAADNLDSYMLPASAAARRTDSSALDLFRLAP